MVLLAVHLHDLPKVFLRESALFFRSVSAARTAIDTSCVLLRAFRVRSPCRWIKLFARQPLTLSICMLYYSFCSATKLTQNRPVWGYIREGIVHYSRGWTYWSSSPLYVPATRLMMFGGAENSPALCNDSKTQNGRLKFCAILSFRPEELAWRELARSV